MLPSDPSELYMIAPVQVTQEALYMLAPNGLTGIPVPTFQLRDSDQKQLDDVFNFACLPLTVVGFDFACRPLIVVGCGYFVLYKQPPV